MVGLTETSVWENEIYQIEQTDAVVAGEPNLGAGQGIPNVPNQQLANRTQWLKSQLTATAALLSGYVPTTRLISTGAGLTGGGALSANRTLAVSFATQAEAETGTEAQKAMSPLGVKQAIAAALADLLDGAPTALDTLNELAAALGDDPNFAATITDMINQLSNNLGDAAAYSVSGDPDFAVNGEMFAVRSVIAAYIEAFRDATALGWGQEPEDMTAERLTNTVYHNTTGHPIWLSIEHASDFCQIDASKDGASFNKIARDGSSQTSTIYAIIPDDWRYKFWGAAIYKWTELRS